MKLIALSFAAIILSGCITNNAKPERGMIRSIDLGDSVMVQQYEYEWPYGVHWKTLYVKPKVEEK